MNFFRLLGRAASLWFHKDADQHAAALAYFTPFALTPLIIFSITIVGIIMGTERVTAMLLRWGNEIDTGVTDLLYNSVQNFKSIEQHFLIPVIGLVFLSIMIFVALNSFMIALHRIWDVEVHGFSGYFSRILRIAAVVLVVQAYLVFLMLMDDTVAYLTWVNTTWWWAFFEYVVTFVFTMALLALSYGLLSLQCPPYGARFAGAAVAGILLLFSREIVDFHFSTAPVQSLFGAAGLLITLLVWVYVSAGIILFGAAFARVYAEEHQDNTETTNQLV